MERYVQFIHNSFSVDNEGVCEMYVSAKCRKRRCTQVKDAGINDGVVCLITVCFFVFLLQFSLSVYLPEHEGESVVHVTSFIF